jgi:hydroxypyruvate isomerase
MIRYSCNVSMLFKEVPFLDRFAKAREAGFAAVEFLSPFDCDLGKLVAAIERADLRVVQYNSLDGSLAQGDRGFLSHPLEKQRWCESLEEAINLAAELRPRQLNSLAGNLLSDDSRDRQIACLEENLSWAVPRLQAAGLPLMLEALNIYDNPSYLLTHSWDVLEILQRIDTPWVRFQCDVYHMQRMQGNLVETIRENIGKIGHIQIADSPGRHQPGTGEINYKFVLKALEDAAYDGFVGLEYVPLGTTEESLAWLPFDQRGGSTANDVRLKG